MTQGRDADKAPAQQPLSEEQEREAFEAWMQANSPGVNLSWRVDGSYWDHVPDNFWEAWQARAAHGIGGEK